MKAILYDALDMTRSARNRGLPSVDPENVLEMHRRFDACCDRAIEFHEGLPPLARPTGKVKRGRRKRRIGHDLARRMQAHKAAILLFLEDLSVPFTNNEGERDLRMTKVRQKVSGSFRTEEGAENFCMLRTVIETARKQGWDILESLSMGADFLIRKLEPA